MTPIEDAWRLAREIPMVPFGTHASGTCLFCRHDSRKEPPDEAHKPDCPWLSLPSIVVALEAAQALVHSAWQHPIDLNGGYRVDINEISALEAALEDEKP